MTGVGQTVRALRLASYLRELSPDAEILVATGVASGDRLFRSGSWTVTAPVELVDLIGALAEHAAEDRVAALRRAASRRVSALAAAFGADVVVSTTHRGVVGEAGELLRSSRERGCRLVLALRDIYHPPRYALDFRSMSGAEFDAVLVAGRAPTRQWLPDGLLTGGLAPKVRLVGYLRPAGACPRRAPIRHMSLRVRCQVGGGRDGAHLVAAVTNAVASLRRRTGRRVDLFATTGPLMPGAEARALQALEQGDVRIRSWSDDVVAPSTRAPGPDVVVSMAGYNSCVEAAWSRVPRVLVARQDPGDLEQSIRATLFAGWFPTIMATALTDVDGNELSRAIEAAATVRTPTRSCSAPPDLFAEPRHVASALLGADDPLVKGIE
ncbi:hypothetical protein [Phytohabitans suffuscus]|nr:hypothetical protein [Phytohabitans suffuscus]